MLSKSCKGALAVLLLAALTSRLPAAAQESNSLEIAKHYSLYQTKFANQYYEDALPYLRWILKHAPAFPWNDDRNYKRGVVLYDSLAARTDDPATQRTHLDAALALHDAAVATLTTLGAKIDVFKWTRDKGRFIQTHPDDFADRIDEAIDAYRKAYTLDPQRLDPYYINLILRDDLSRENYGAALERLDAINQQRGEEPDIQRLVLLYEKQIPLEEQAAFWEQKLADDPSNLAIKQRLLAMYLDLEWRDKAISLAEDLLRVEPTVELLLLLGDFYLHDGQYVRALELFEQTLDMPDFDPSAEIYFNMGLAHQELDDFPRARAHYRKALELNPAFGIAYLAIGDLYVIAVSQCSGEALERADRAVYWLAADWYKKARRADPSVAQEADRNISFYRQHFLNDEERFFQGLKVGQRYTIDYGCYSWIGETTRVKAL